MQAVIGPEHLLPIMTIQISKILQITKTPREGEACALLEGII